jgi:hypothetical protein
MENIATTATDIDMHRARSDTVRMREPLRSFKDLSFTIPIAFRDQADIPLSQLRNLIRLLGRIEKGILNSLVEIGQRLLMLPEQLSNFPSLASSERAGLARWSLLILRPACQRGESRRATSRAGAGVPT